MQNSLPTDRHVTLTDRVWAMTESAPWIRLCTLPSYIAGPYTKMSSDNVTIENAIRMYFKYKTDVRILNSTSNTCIWNIAQQWRWPIIGEKFSWVDLLPTRYWGSRGSPYSDYFVIILKVPRCMRSNASALLNSLPKKSPIRSFHISTCLETRITGRLTRLRILFLISRIVNF